MLKRIGKRLYTHKTRMFLHYVLQHRCKTICNTDFNGMGKRNQLCRMKRDEKR
jgi:hypothetical protein